MDRKLIFLLAFTGGFVIMSIELLGGRILAPWFGSSVYVWGSIITVFMVALSLGYLLGGRSVPPDPSLKRFGSLFIGGALLLGPLYGFGDSLMEAVFTQVEDPRYGSLLASLALFFLPTVMLGMISPYPCAFWCRRRTRVARWRGLLYFVSTFGSALGTLGTSFYFILWFEVDTILLLLGSALLACGVLALLAPHQEA